MNELTLKLNYEGHNLEAIIKVNGGDLMKFTDDCLTAFDNALKNIISLDKFEKSYEDTDLGQRSVIDDIIEGLK
jgi:hypothetical protein